MGVTKRDLTWTGGEQRYQERPLGDELQTRSKDEAENLVM